MQKQTAAGRPSTAEHDRACWDHDCNQKDIRSCHTTHVFREMAAWSELPSTTWPGKYNFRIKKHLRQNMFLQLLMIWFAGLVYKHFQWHRRPPLNDTTVKIKIDDSTAEYCIVSAGKSKRLHKVEWQARLPWICRRFSVCNFVHRHMSQPLKKVR